MRIPAGERVIGLLGYLPLICLVIAWKVKRSSMFVQFHARQGSVLFVLWAVVNILLFVLLAVTGGTGILSTVFLGIMFLALFVYAFLVLAGIIKVLLGERYRMPVVADIALKMGL